MHDIVQNYYGIELTKTEDLKTSACCDEAEIPEWLKPILSNIHPDVLARYYGCGLVAPEDLTGLTILDLGCGTGRDVYALAQMVGPQGKVIGVDMTPEQLDTARDYQEYHAEKFGYSNVEFYEGFIETLDQLPLEAGSVDVVVSNCVVNLAADKSKVLTGVRRLLKPGGEFYFSDIYCERRVPDAVREDPVMYGECLGGALYWNDFLTLAKEAGFLDPRLVTHRPIDVTEPRLAKLAGNLAFHSATYRLLALDNLEPACEAYGQAVIYKGTIEHHEHGFALDQHHMMEPGAVFSICGNTYRMLAESRFAKHFTFIGDFSQHYGIFPGCGTISPFDTDEPAAGCC